MSPKETHHRFDLPRFVVEFLEQNESLVEPPAFGVYEALLPDKLAADLHLEPYQRLTFAAAQTDAPKQMQDEAVVQLSYNHPVVEEIAQRLLQEPVNARVFINHVRLDKQGLLDLALKQYKFPNARLSPKAGATQGRALHHYLRFNFKVTLTSDEKQEFMVFIMMDVQRGHVVRDADLLARLELYETTSAFETLGAAPLQWRDADDPLAHDALSALFTRAEVAVQEDIADTLTGLQTRTERHLQLDRARIEGYYDDLERDMEKRLKRRTSTSANESAEQRQASAKEKLAALHAERQTKLAHLVARHQVRVELELINLLLIVQPKVRLPVIIGNRSARITRPAVWDPLMHRMELFNCDVCGQPGENLHLCTGGHLAHDHCLARQCIDCSRVYCQRCSDQITECVVCHEPVCQRSLITCPTCGRGTCREHQKLCHAADGQPVDLADLQPEPETQTAPDPAPEPPAPPRTTPKGKVTQRNKRGAKRSTATAPANKERLVKAARIHVEVYEDEPRIVAYVMRSTNRTWAIRSFLLTPKGIHVECQCEKSSCSAHNYYHRPAYTQHLAAQLEEMLKDLRKEYLTPVKKTTYHYMRHSRIQRQSQVFILPPIWKNEAMLRDARRGFDAM